jgi:Zn ribbon nucleic-acid-binding protein
MEGVVMGTHFYGNWKTCPNCEEVDGSNLIVETRPPLELLECPHCGYMENITEGTFQFMSLEGLNYEREFCDLPPLKELPIQGVQNTPKNRPSESQQNQGVKSSDLGVQKGNVL